MAMVVYQGVQSCVEESSCEISKGNGHDGRKFTGLSNQGATCYLNGLLQTLYMTPEFRKAMFEWNYDAAKDGNEDLCIPLQLQRLFGLLQLSKQRSVDTVALTKSFGWEGSEVFQQQDVQELTRVLFDALEESFKGTSVENIIDDLYAGQLVDYLRCIDVEYESQRVDKFLDFSLAIVPFGSDRPMHSLTECIEMYLRPEILNGDNKYYAEKFDRKVDAIKGLKFGRLPQIMSVQLKRFVYDFTGATIVQKKLNDVVKFPMVLDMNKYVATIRRKKRCRSTANGVERDLSLNNSEGVSHDSNGVMSSSEAAIEVEDNEEEADQFDPNVEFEAFLKEQLDILNGSNAGEGADAVEGSGKSDSAAVSPANVGSNYDLYADIDIDESGPSVPAFAAGGSHKKKRVSEGTDSESDGECDDDMPRLVDYTGLPAPDQVRASARRAQREEAAGREKAMYSSMADEEVRRLLAERGEWVYELYAVLIHSGAISGGHYYAYVKDLETRRWLNFNDSSVTPIDEQTVQEAWGGSVTVTSSSSGSSTGYMYGASGPTKPTTTTRLSSANAYMLMYRKLTADTVSTGSSSFPSDQDVPAYIRDQIAADDARRAAKEAEQEESRNRLRIKVFWEDKEHTIITSRQLTLRDLYAQIWNQLNLGPYIAERDLMAVFDSHSEASGDAMDAKIARVEQRDGANLKEPLFDRFRIRGYNHANKNRLEEISVVTSGSKTLGELMFSEYRANVLEVRAANEEFEEYHADGIPLLLEEFCSVKRVFKEVRSVRMRRDSTLGDLKALIAKSTPYGADRVQIAKFLLTNEARMELLGGGDERQLRRDLNLFDNTRLYFEERPEPPEGGEDVSLKVASPAFEHFVALRNQINVLVNKPPSLVCDILVSANAKWTVQELRRAVLRALEWGEEVEIRMFKLSLRGMELKENGLSLSANAVYSAMNVYVTLGKATPAGHYQLMMVEYIAPSGRSGVVPLPELKQEEEEVEGEVEIRVTNYGSKTTAQSDWAAKATLELAEIRYGMGRDDPADGYEGDTDTSVASAGLGQHSNRTPLEFPEPSSSSAAAVSAMYRRQRDVAGQEDIDSDCEAVLMDDDNGRADARSVEIDAGVAEYCDGSNVAEGEGSVGGYQENIHNLIFTEEAPPASSYEENEFDRYPAAAIGEDRMLVTLEEAAETEAGHGAVEVIAASVGRLAPIVLSDSHVDFMNCENNADQVAEVVDGSTVILLPDAVGPSGGSEVEPSGFGELTVNNHMPSDKVFRALDAIGDVTATMTMQVADLRRDITDRLIAAGKLPAGASPRLVRLRDKLGDNPGRVLRDGRTIQESRLVLYDNKSMAVQILDAEEDLSQHGGSGGGSGNSSEDIGDVLISVQRWNRSSWSMGERFEVQLKGSMTVRDVSRALAQLTDIPLRSLRAMVVPRDSELYLSELTQKAPKRNYGRGWFDPTQETKLLRYMTHELRLQDCDLLLLQDCAEPLKELSPADLRSIQIVEAAAHAPYTDPWSSSGVLYSRPYNSAYGTNTSTVTWSGGVNGGSKAMSGGANGIRIKTHQERLRESEKQQNQSKLGTTEGDVSEGSSNPSHSSSNSLVTQQGDEAAIAAAATAGANDELEFERQGGAALFEDLC